MLGHKLAEKWKERFDVFTTLRGDFSQYERYEIFEKEKTFENIDVEDIKAVEKVVKNVTPEVIFNAVGIIKQLPSSKNVVKTLKINSIFPHQLSELAEKYGARLINISTDCIFDGKRGNYREEDLPNAVDLYGKSKNLGEVIEGNCLTIRTSIIGREIGTSHSLVEWFLGNRGEKVRGFVNAIYTGFPTCVLAEIIAEYILTNPNLRGLYHISSEKINKFELLNLIKQAYKIECEIEPFADFRIDRSLNSEKFRKETGFEPLEWSEMIKKMAEDSKKYEHWRSETKKNEFS